MKTHLSRLYCEAIARRDRTLDELVDLVEVPIREVNDWIWGEKRPSVVHRLKLAEVLSLQHSDIVHALLLDGGIEAVVEHFDDLKEAEEAAGRRLVL